MTLPATAAVFMKWRREMEEEQSGQESKDGLFIIRSVTVFDPLTINKFDFAVCKT